MPTYEDVVALYIATFNRAPDKAGIDYWVNDSGLSIEEIAQSFFDQPETQTLYPDDQNDLDGFITDVYNNVLDRNPDEEGLSYWKEQLENGNISQDKFILAIINGAKEHEADAQTLAYKEEVGLAFVEADLNDVTLAKEVMEQLEPTEESVVEVKSIIATAAETTQMEENGGNMPDHAQEMQNNAQNYADDMQENAEGQTDMEENGENMPDHAQEMQNNAQDHANDMQENAEDQNDDTANLNEIEYTDEVLINEEQALELTPEEIDSLVFMYQEEKMAGDVYKVLYDQYDLKIFDKISDSEDKHEAAVADLLVNAGVDMTELNSLNEGEFLNEELQALYDTLVDQGSNSLEDALLVGVAIEETDIEDLNSYLSDENINTDIETVYSNLLDGSVNHLAAFEGQLDDFLL